MTKNTRRGRRAMAVVALCIVALIGCFLWAHSYCRERCLQHGTTFALEDWLDVWLGVAPVTTKNPAGQPVNVETRRPIIYDIEAFRTGWDPCGINAVYVSHYANEVTTKPVLSLSSESRWTYEAGTDLLLCPSASGKLADCTANLTPQPDPWFTTCARACDLDGRFGYELVIATDGDRSPNVLYVGNDDLYGPYSATRCAPDAFFGSDPAMDVEVADLDLNGWNDVVFAIADGPNVVYFNNGPRSDGTLTPSCFRRVELSSTHDPTDGVAIGDVNGDGYPDVVVANSIGRTNQLYINDRRQGFVRETDPQRWPSLGYAGQQEWDSRDVEIVDLNGDGDLDVYFANNNEEPNVILWNRGDASFSLSWHRDTGGYCNDAEFFEFDGDGIPDLVLGSGFWLASYGVDPAYYSGTTHSIYVGTGNGFRFVRSLGQPALCLDVEATEVCAFVFAYSGEVPRTWFEEWITARNQW